MIVVSPGARRALQTAQTPGSTQSGARATKGVGVGVLCLPLFDSEALATQ